MVLILPYNYLNNTGDVCEKYKTGWNSESLLIPERRQAGMNTNKWPTGDAGAGRFFCMR